MIVCIFSGRFYSMKQCHAIVELISSDIVELCQHKYATNVVQVWLDELTVNQDENMRNQMIMALNFVFQQPPKYVNLFL